MPRKMFISTYETGPLGYLITARKALRVLLANKKQDSRLQLFVLKWTGALLAMVSAAIFEFSLVPMFLAMSIIVPCVCFFSLLLWLAAGDIFLKFALEDEGFFNAATASNALSVFEDTESD